MHAVTKLFIWMCLGGSALAHHSLQSCDPPSMTGYMSVVDLRSGLLATAEYSYDSVAHKLRFKENGTNIFNKDFKFDFILNRTSNVDVLMLFGEGVFYEIDNKNQSCEKKSLQVHAHPFDVPSEAQHIAESSLGSMSTPGEGLKFNTWMVAVPEIKSHYFMSTTLGGCLPVSAVFNTDSVSLIFSNLNIVTEIKDPDVFTLPAFCENVELEETPEGTVNSFFGLFT